MKKCVLGVLCALLVTIVSCKKMDRSSPAISISDSLPENTLNPYDSLGYWHNVILDSLDKHRTLRRAYSFGRSCDYIRKFCQRRGWPLISPTTLDSVPLIVNDAATNAYQFIDNSRWSDSVKVKLKSLMYILYGFGEDSCGYPSVKSVIRSFEHEVLNSSLPQKDKEALLKCSSIARYSGYRWIQQPQAWMIYQPRMLAQVYLQQDIKVAPVTYDNIIAGKRGLFERVGKWIAVTAIDISGVITDLSIESGAAASDFMKEVFEL